jgi:hypothetical protein
MDLATQIFHTPVVGIRIRVGIRVSLKGVGVLGLGLGFWWRG